ncbi:uncharacterized protein [Cicer arietinum]|uniref:Uncharacterized protein LOC101514414 n=1 Tax=Cicer arietinum TaxID=3827 RepID=A0A1S2XJG2_CICAR|nr:uncharacterized protein LOC101514414 [Cicer arietinum]
MKESGIDQFPGFQIYSHRDELMFRNSMNRLQKRAPCPLQIIKPSVLSSTCSGKGSTSTSTSSSNSFNSFFTSKDPIPLLSPLVVLESTSIREENTVNSH